MQGFKNQSIKKYIYRKSPIECERDAECWAAYYASLTYRSGMAPDFGREENDCGCMEKCWVQPAEHQRWMKTSNTLAASTSESISTYSSEAWVLPPLGPHRTAGVWVSV